MIKAKIAGRNVALVISASEGLPERVMAAGSIGLARGLQGVVAISQREYLQGPRPGRLGERTARLRQSIVSKVERDGDRVIGVIGTNVSYGAFHEFGFHGVEQVRGHSRVVKTLSAAGAEVDTRRLFKDKAGVVIGFRESRASAARRGGQRTVTQYVKEHQRRVDYAGRPFVRPALLQGMPMVISEIRKELRGVKPVES
jgi:hypothetical protein